MRKAIIVGGSMASVLAGNMLTRQGWEVDILERTKGSLEARGAGTCAFAADTGTKRTCTARPRSRYSLEQVRRGSDRATAHMGV